MTLSYAMVLAAGDGARAIALVDRALELNPDPPGWYRYYECRASFFSGQYERCVAVACAADDFITTFLFGCLSATELGRTELAKDFWDRLIRLYPGFGFHEYAAPMTHPAVAAGLSLVGRQARLAWHAPFEGSCRVSRRVMTEFCADVYTRLLAGRGLYA